MEEVITEFEATEEDFTPETPEEIVNDDLSILRESFPELKDIEDITELNNPTRYAALRDLGLSAREAYLATAQRQAPRDNRSHLRSGVPAAAKIPSTGMTKAQMAEARSIFRGMSDSDIVKLYTKVNK